MPPSHPHPPTSSPRGRGGATIRNLATLLALLLPAAPGAAQETPPTEDTFFERIAVDIVNVEVYVTDKDGEPVTGLYREDFVVNEDGRPVEVVNFHHVSGGRVASGTEPATQPPDTERDLLAVPRMVEASVPESQRLHLVVYVDNFHIHPLNRNRVFGRLRAFLQKVVKPGDEVMVASYDRSLHIRHPFTGDPDLVNNMLRELENFSGSAVERESERSTALKGIYEAQTLREAESRAREFSDAGYHELGLALDALSEMIDSLAGLPGGEIERLELSPRGSWRLAMASGVEITLGKMEDVAAFERRARAFTKVFGDRLSEVQHIDMRYANGFSVRRRASRH